MAKSNLFNTISSLSADGKIVALRSIANSSLFRLFGACDRVAKLQEEAGRRFNPKATHDQGHETLLEAKRLAGDFACVYASMKAKLESVTSDPYQLPMEPEKVEEYLVTANPINNDKVLAKLAKALGEDPEQLIKLRNDYIVAKAQKNQLAAKRVGGEGGDFECAALGGVVEDVEYALDIFEERTECAGMQIVLRKLRAAYDQKLKFALTSDSGEGFSELFLLREDIRIVEAETDFDL